MKRTGWYIHIIHYRQQFIIQYCPTVHVYRLGQLTWHSGAIPSNEIWIKLGGDKGGSSFKTSVQVVYVDKPNSVKNSCVFAVFEAPDSFTNLKIALGQFKNQIEGIQLAQWK